MLLTHEPSFQPILPIPVISTSYSAHTVSFSGPLGFTEISLVTALEAMEPGRMELITEEITVSCNSQLCSEP